MKVTKLNCTACGSPMSIPEDIDQITCTSCGTGLIIERGEGYVALKLAEKIARTIEVSGIQTQDVIRENTQVTRAELQRLQVSQELSSLQMQLNGIQTEIRMLQRDTKNSKAKKQLGGLQEKEYQVMERIHSLKKQKFSPDPIDLKTSIDFYAWEYAWVEAEIVALLGSNLSQKYQLINGLNRQKTELIFKINGLKIREVRNRFSSFTLPDPPVDNAEQFLAVLAKVDEDELRLHQLRGTQEGKAVHEEILRRQKNLRKTANHLELEHFQRNLNSLNYQPDTNDRASLVAYLNQLDTDIERLNQPNASEFARNLRIKLIAARNTAAKQLKALEKASSRSNKPARSSGFFTWIGASIAGLLAGIALILTSIFSRSNNSNSQKIPNYHVESGSPSESSEEHFAADGQAADLKPTAFGCLYWILTFIGISAIGTILTAIISGEAEASSGITVAVLISATLGFILGGRIFLQRTAANIRVKGIGSMRSIYIRSKNPGRGIRSLKAVKFWVGFITFFCVFMVFFIVDMSLGETQSNLSAIIILVSIPLAILLSVIIAKRTDLVSPTGIE